MRIDPRNSFLATLLLVSACGTTAVDKQGTVEWLIVHGRFQEAVDRAAAKAKDHPGDEQAQRTYREAQFAQMLESGRRLSFADRDLEALDLFRRATELAPDRNEAVTWIEKTRRKLAEHFLEIGLEAHASDKLDEALVAYESALQFDPGNRGALTGMADATLAVNYRAGLGKAYYEEGLRSFKDGLLGQADGEFGKGDKYIDSPQLDQRRKQLAVEMAAARMTVAATLVEEAKFDAARNEYRLALALDPGNAAAKTGKESCDLESHAAQIHRDAEMAIVRGRLDKALELAEEGARLTVLQKDRFEGLKNRVQEARFETIYKEALAMERDGKFPDAIVRYGDLLKIAAYYKDALTRKETLEDFVVRADRLYSQAAGETDATKKLETLRQILQFWADYRDVADQVRELAKTVTPQ
ncbi:MAG: hypothetical protein HZA53_13915 [Planctomycetes bacterium]|nr:hypothetical protein [Planctomycetota bacterium]